MLKDLIKLADELDRLNFVRESNRVDSLIKKVAGDDGVMITSDIFNLLNDISSIKDDIKEFGLAEDREMLARRMTKLYAWAEENGLSKEEADEMVEEHYQMFSRTTDENKRKKEIENEKYRTYILLSKATQALHDSAAKINGAENRIKKIERDPTVIKHLSDVPTSDVAKIFGNKNPKEELDRYMSITKEIAKLMQEENYDGAKAKGLQLLGEYRAIWSNYTADFVEGGSFGVIFEPLSGGIRKLKESLDILDEVIMRVNEGKEEMSQAQSQTIKERLLNIINMEYVSDTSRPIRD